MRSAMRGFTLMEILLVVVLISILAGLSGTYLVRRFDKAKVRLAEVEIKGRLSQALWEFYTENGFYPTTDQGLEALVQKPAGVPGQTHYEEEGYLEEVPADPWGMPYQYVSPGTQKPRSFDLWSMGRDRQSGNEDDIVNWQKR